MSNLGVLSLLIRGNSCGRQYAKFDSSGMLFWTMFLKALPFMFVASASILPEDGPEGKKPYGVRPVCCYKKDVLPIINVRPCDIKRNDPHDPLPEEWEFNCWQRSGNQGSRVASDITYLPAKADYQIAIHLYRFPATYFAYTNFRVRCADVHGTPLESRAIHCLTREPHESRQHIPFVHMHNAQGEFADCVASRENPIILEQFEFDVSHTVECDIINGPHDQV